MERTAASIAFRSVKWKKYLTFEAASFTRHRSGNQKFLLPWYLYLVSAKSDRVFFFSDYLVWATIMNIRYTVSFS